MQEQERFKKVLKTPDIIALAFGAAIGWAWVVLVGDWIRDGGTIGAILGFVIGGVLVFFVGITYAELCSAMPRCGGEQVFSLRALGYNPSFVCSWALCLSYIGVVAFEASSLPTVLTHIIPAMSSGGYYTIAGMNVYYPFIIVGFLGAVILTYINYIGIKFASMVQRILTFIIVAVGLLIVIGVFTKGEAANVQPYFADGGKGILAVAVITPFFMVGFDVIPQAAEEVDIDPKKLGHLMLFSIALCAVWYCIIIGCVSLVMSHGEIEAADMVTAQTLTKIWNGNILARYVVVIGGACGILTTWNSFIAAGSRVMFSMAESGMLPKWFAKLHPKYNTPSNAIIFIGVVSALGTVFGKQVLSWISNAASLSTVVAYGMVAVSFCVLRKKEPDMPRPYKVKNGMVKGVIAVLLTVLMLVLYLPGMPSGLTKPEWIILAVWTVLGIGMFNAAKKWRASVK